MRLPWQKHDDDLRRELTHHLDELTDEYIRSGHSPQEARQMALKQFGQTELIKDQCRDESRWAWLQSLGQDLQFGLRQLRQTPVVTAAAVLSLALGIGANSAIVSLMNTVLWRALPVPAPEQLVFFHWQSSGFPDQAASMAAGGMYKEGAGRVADFFNLNGVEAMSKAGQGRIDISTYSFSQSASIGYQGNPWLAHNRSVGAKFFDVLRVPARIGRTFRPDEDRPDASPVAVVTSKFFERVLGNDANAIGRTITIDNKPYELIGVLPAWFYGLQPGDSTEVYSPMWHSSEFGKAREGQIPFKNPRAWVVQALGRLAPGESASNVQTAIAGPWRQSWEVQGKSKRGVQDPVLRLDDGRRGLGDLSREFRQPLAVLGAMLFLVLLIACANIANLLLARSTARAKEVALRISLGCSQGRLLRQFLTESALLALMGGVASVFVAFAVGRGLATFMAGRNSSEEVRLYLDLPMVGAIALISILTLLLFGLFPAWRASRMDSSTALKQGAGSLGSAARHWWTPGRLLIISQMALSIVLVSAAILFAENLRALATKNTGFERENILVFDLRPGTSGYTKDTLPGFYRNLEATLRNAPGVETASLATIRPMNQGGWWDTVRELGKTKNYDVAMNSVTSSYIDVFAPKLVAGRNFSVADTLPNAARVAIISEDLARAIDPSGSMLGRKIHTETRPNQKPDPIEVIGITPSLNFNSMKDRPYVVWRPFDGGANTTTVVLRTKANPLSVLPQVRQAVTALDRNLPLAEPFSMDQLVRRNLQRETMFASLCGSFGVLALLLSVIGLYGVMAYNTSRRRNEIGVRLALGAERSNVIWMVLREAILLTALGLGVGAPAIYFGAQYIESELHQLKALNPWLLSFSVGLLLVAALFAAFVPARRAGGLDPATALRQD